MKGFKRLGLGGLVGLGIGIAAAEWLGNENDGAYYAVVGFFAGGGAVIGKAIGAKSKRPKD